MKMMVKVWGDDVEVEVYQRSKTVFEASGAYLDQSFTVKGRSARAAASHWADVARSRTG